MTAFEVGFDCAVKSSAQGEASRPTPCFRPAYLGLRGTFPTAGAADRQQ